MLLYIGTTTHHTMQHTYLASMCNNLLIIYMVWELCNYITQQYMLATHTFHADIAIDGEIHHVLHVRLSFDNGTSSVVWVLEVIHLCCITPQKVEGI